MPAIANDPAAALTATILEAIASWEAGQGAGLLPATQARTVAEAVQAVLCARPMSYTLLGLLMDEERHAALAGLHLKGGSA